MSGKMGCDSCESFSSHAEGEYGGGPRWNECSEKPLLSNLKTFPFKKTMPCFQVDFWCSDFANLVNPDLGSQREKRIFELWKKSDKFGKLSDPKDLEEFEVLKKQYWSSWGDD